MIKSFIFENFKSFSKAKLDIENLTILVGSNASGKTNTIEGIKILSAIATGMELSMLLDGTKSIEIRGGSKGCARFDSDYFIVGCILEYKQNIDLEYRLHIRVGDRIFVEDESLIKKIENEEDDFVFKTKKSKKDSADIKVTYNNGKKGMNPDITCIRTASVLSQLTTKLPTETIAEKEDHECISFMIKYLRNMFFFDPQPASMTDYIRKIDVELRPNAENISPVLFKLFKDRNVKDKVLRYISKLPENEIRDISFVETPLDEVMLVLQEAYSPKGIIESNGESNKAKGKDKQSFIEAKRLSYGTLRCLAIITALLSKETGSMVLIEEVDNGIHPNRAQGLINAISEITKERGIDVIITTHNPALLNAINRDDLVGVVVCYRDAETGSSEFIQLLDIEKYPELMAKGRLGDLLTKDELTKAIKTENKDYDSNWLGV
ncbi:MAG: recombination protein F [Firmicutes bacterium ADurb.Bin419]|nr:MAG: recombination protein F [Firmicutes bacterium ADurb.Bin419]